MDPGATVVAISTLAAAIAQDKTLDEVELLALFFSQLGDVLATIGALMEKDQGEIIVDPIAI